jgi:hypothetical protein
LHQFFIRLLSFFLLYFCQYNSNNPYISHALSQKVFTLNKSLHISHKFLLVNHYLHFHFHPHFKFNFKLTTIFFFLNTSFLKNIFLLLTNKELPLNPFPVSDKFLQFIQNKIFIKAQLKSNLKEPKLIKKLFLLTLFKNN